MMFTILLNRRVRFSRPEVKLSDGRILPRAAHDMSGKEGTVVGCHADDTALRLTVAFEPDGQMRTFDAADFQLLPILPTLKPDGPPKPAPDNPNV